MPYSIEQGQIDAYAKGGTILAKTARGIGIPVTKQDEQTWVETMGRLKVADELSEQANLQPSDVLSILNLPATPPLVHTTEQLLLANHGAQTANTIDTHLDYRADEAVASWNLLRYSTADAIADESLWHQLELCCVAGIYFDSIGDALEDSKSLPFTASELAKHSTKRLLATARSIKHDTYSSALSALRSEKVGRYIAKKPLRIVRAMGSVAL